MSEAYAASPLKELPLVREAAPISPLAIKLREQGYLKIDQMASAEDVAMIYSELRRIQRDKLGVKEGAQFDFVGDGQSDKMSFPEIARPSVFAPGLLKTAHFKAATALARELLGDEVRFNGDFALVKPAKGGPATPWHQDEAFRDPTKEIKEVSIWLALRETTVENGCMAFIPGSHKRGVLPHRRLSDNPRIPALECVGDFNPSQAVLCPIPAGGVTVHTESTLHWAGPNLSDHDRHGYVLIFELLPRPARVPREAPWLAVPDSRMERERAWRRRGGIFVHIWRQLKRYDLRDVKQLGFVLGRGGRMLLKWVGISTY